MFLTLMNYFDAVKNHRKTYKWNLYTIMKQDGGSRQITSEF